MDLMKKLTVYVSLLLVLCCSNVHGEVQPIFFKVTDFGAIPDGETDNSAAFLKTWAKACATNGGGVLVPGGTFLIKSASFEGPCTGVTFFRVIGNLVATRDPQLASGYWIQFYQINGLELSGEATFDGQGPFAWPHKKCDGPSECNLPISIAMAFLKNSAISGIKSLNSKGFHMTIFQCDNMLVRDVKLLAPADSPNTDGIHIGKSDGIRVIKSKISTGDDCVSLGDGNTNINITGVDCGPGHGISIGSLGKYKDEQNVRGIAVTNCNFTKTDNGLRIKTWAPSVEVTVSDITFADIFVNDVQNPIIIDQYYCPQSHCAPGESSVAIQNVKFTNVKGTSTKDVAVNFKCSKLRPCQGIELRGLELRLSGTGKPTKATCSNAGTSFIGRDQVPANC